MVAFLFLVTNAENLSAGAVGAVAATHNTTVEC